MGRSGLRCAGAIIAGVTALALSACGSGNSPATAPASTSTTTETITRSTSITVSTSSAPRAPRAVGAAGVPGCLPGHTAVSLGGGSAGLGHVGEVVLFRNSGVTACTLSGYPGAALVSASGRHGLLQIARTPQGYLGGLLPRDRTDPVVRIRPGQAASALLEGEDSTRGGGACPRYPALLVTPPNQTVTVHLSWAFVICDPEIHPVVAGLHGTQSQ